MKKLTPTEQKIKDDLDKQFESLQEKVKAHMSNQINLAFRTSASFSTATANISPTDVDAQGMYEYQEPEMDEQGTLYGYKILHYRDERLFSPRYSCAWGLGGELTSDREPNERSMHGLHFTKRENHPELNNYIDMWQGLTTIDRNALLVKCALSGTVVETSQGFRAQHAQIIGVVLNGNWTSYQDFYERAQSYSRRITEENEHARWISNYYPNDKKGYSFDIDPNP